MSSLHAPNTDPEIENIVHPALPLPPLSLGRCARCKMQVGEWMQKTFTEEMKAKIVKVSAAIFIGLCLEAVLGFGSHVFLKTSSLDSALYSTAITAMCALIYLGYRHPEHRGKIVVAIALLALAIVAAEAVDKFNDAMDKFSGDTVWPFLKDHILRVDVLMGTTAAVTTFAAIYISCTMKGAKRWKYLALSMLPIAAFLLPGFINGCINHQCGDFADKLWQDMSSMYSMYAFITTFAFGALGLLYQNRSRFKRAVRSEPISGAIPEATSEPAPHHPQTTQSNGTTTSENTSPPKYAFRVGGTQTPSDMDPIPPHMQLVVDPPRIEVISKVNAAV